MTKLIDLPIGETFDYNGTKLKVVEETSESFHCSGCYFNLSHEGCSSYLCSSGMREDGKEVIFKSVPLKIELKDRVVKWQEDIMMALSVYQEAHLAYCKADREYQTAAEEAEQAHINYQDAHTRLTDTMSALSEAQRLEKEKLQALNRLLEGEPEDGATGITEKDGKKYRWTKVAAGYIVKEVEE